LFLDEAGELSLGAQAKLLRAIEAREVTRIGDVTPRPVDFRLVAASNRDLAAESTRRQFREDLYYRLAAATVTVPPLRDHPGDIPVLARMFVARACEAMARSPLHLSDAAMQLLLSYRFPGNIRELANAMDYGVATAAGDRIEPCDLPAGLGTGEPGTGEPGSQARFQPLAEELAALEKRRMTEALAVSGGNQSEAAKLLGMPRRTFVSKMRQYWLR
jgi:DNA-binding NtrC family response regulator